MELVAIPWLPLWIIGVPFVLGVIELIRTPKTPARSAAGREPSLRGTILPQQPKELHTTA